MKRALLPLLVLLVAAPAAVAAFYGKGTFTGQVDTLGTGQKGAVVVKVVQGKARIKKIVLSVNCTGVDGLPDRLPMPASSKYGKVEEGPAGGGARVRIEGTRQYKGRTFDVVGKVFLGLRADEVLGTVDGHLRGDTGCGDTYADFTARR